jgi:hypothetical protein
MPQPQMREIHTAQSRQTAIRNTLGSDPAVRSAALSAGTTVALSLLARRNPLLFRIAVAGLALWSISAGVRTLRSVTR